MSRKPKRKSKSSAGAKPSRPSAPVTADLLEREIESRRQAGGLAKALVLCEQLLGLRPGAESEKLCWETTLESIEHALARGRFAEALKQIHSARQRPVVAPLKLEVLDVRARAGLGGWDPLFRELAAPQAEEARMRAVEEAIRHDLLDLELLARTDHLPTDHALRQAAGKLVEAFRQVTTGPVASLDLPDLSRRSPLAGWRLLVMAIASFYSGSDEQCLRQIQAIPAGSAAESGAAILAAALQGKSKPPLANRLRGSQSGLRAAAEALDQALRSGANERKLTSLAQEAVQQIQAYAPDKLQPFRQRLFVRMSVLGIKSAKLSQVCLPFEARSFFWREWALGHQRVDGAEHVAAAAWEEYRQHARAEGLLEPREESALLVRIATLVEPDPLHRKEMQEECVQFLRLVYGLQPKSIRSISAIGAGGKPPSDYLDPERCFQRACALDPHRDTFAAWLDWEKSIGKGRPERAAEAWHQVFPDDPQPLLLLIEANEERGASAKAQSLLGRALEIDRLNPELLFTQMRLAVANARRLLKTGKLHLVDPHLRTLESSELMRRGARPAVLAGLHCMLFSQQRKTDLAKRAFERVVEQIGSQAIAMVLLTGLAEGKANELFDALGLRWKTASNDLLAVPTLSRITRDFKLAVRMPVNWPRDWIKRVNKAALKMSLEDLSDLCDFANRGQYFELAYAVSGAGLRRQDLPKARLLLQRARSLPSRRSARFQDCLAVAHHLAALENDASTVGESVELARASGIDLREIEVDEIAADLVLVDELDIKGYPKAGEDLCNCANCRAERAGLDLDHFGDLDLDFESMPDELLEILLKGMKDLKPKSRKGRKARV